MRDARRQWRHAGASEAFLPPAPLGRRRAETVSANSEAAGETEASVASSTIKVLIAMGNGEWKWRGSPKFAHRTLCRTLAKMENVGLALVCEHKTTAVAACCGSYMKEVTKAEARCVCHWQPGQPAAAAGRTGAVSPMLVRTHWQCWNGRGRGRNGGAAAAVQVSVGAAAAVAAVPRGQVTHWPPAPRLLHSRRHHRLRARALTLAAVTGVSAAAGAQPAPTPTALRAAGTAT